MLGQHFPRFLVLMATNALVRAATPKQTGGRCSGAPRRYYTTRLGYELRNYGDGWFGIEYTGRFYVTTAGDYYFQLTVDDGGEVIIDVNWLFPSTVSTLSGRKKGVRVCRLDGTRFVCRTFRGRFLNIVLVL